MQKMIAPHLKSTYELIKRTFPNGIETEAYFPLLAILSDEMSDRNLAEVVAYCTGKAYGSVLNDIYAVQSISPPSSDATTKVKNRLLACGYERWLNEG